MTDTHMQEGPNRGPSVDVLEWIDRGGVVGPNVILC